MTNKELRTEISNFLYQHHINQRYADLSQIMDNYRRGLYSKEFHWVNRKNLLLDLKTLKSWAIIFEWIDYLDILYNQDRVLQGKAM